MIFCGDLFCSIVERGSEIDQVVDGNAVAAIGGRLRRNWLSWRIRFAWDAADFDWLFWNWPDRFSGDAIEDVENPCFDGCATALTGLPSTVISARIGAEEMSISQSG